MMKKILLALIFIFLIMNVFAVDRIINPEPPTDENISEIDDDYVEAILSIITVAILSIGSIAGVIILLVVAIKLLG